MFAGGLREIDRRLVRVGLLAIVRLDLVRVALLPAGLALGEFLVQVPGVQEHEGGKLHGPGGRVDGTAVAGLDQQRQQAAMVQVRVGEDDRVELGRLEGERDPVADRLVGAALEHAAVDEHPRSIGRQQELRAGHGGRATQEVDLHACIVTGTGLRRGIVAPMTHLDRIATP